MKCEDGYKFGVTVEYDGQTENLIAKCKIDANAFMLAQYILDSVRKNPIIRVVDLESGVCLSAVKREVKELEKKTSITV